MRPARIAHFQKRILRSHAWSPKKQSFTSSQAPAKEHPNARPLQAPAGKKATLYRATRFLRTRPMICALRRRPTAGAVPATRAAASMQCSDHCRPRCGRRTWARPLLGRLQLQKGLGGDRGRPEEEKYGINTIAPDRVIQRQFFGDPPTAVAAAIIEHALDFDGRYGVHTSPRVWLPCANLCIRRPLPHQDEAFLPPPCRILLVRPRFMAGLFYGGRRWWLSSPPPETSTARP